MWCSSSAQPKDSSHLTKFYMGNISVYPDLYLLEDTLDLRRDTATVNNYKFYYNSRRFKLPFIAENISLTPGSLIPATKILPHHQYIQPARPLAECRPRPA